MSDPDQLNDGDETLQAEGTVVPPGQHGGGSAFAGFKVRATALFHSLIGDRAIKDLVKGIVWTMGGAAVERLLALFQAIYIARLLGIELFGKYGLLFTTVGLVSSLAGLQLGLTAAVHVARFGKDQPAHAAAVVRLCELVSFVLALILVLSIAIAPTAAAELLLKDAAHADIILAGASIALFSAISGVQEGVLQGFEAFKKLSIARVATSLISVTILLVFARAGDLSSVILALAFGVMVRAAIMIGLKEVTLRGRAMTTSLAAMWQSRRVIFAFSLPSLLASLIGGLASWYGLLLLAGMPQGFREVAILTAAQQWRGMVFYFTTITASVAIPIMSRLTGAGDAVALRRVHRLNLTANVSAAIIVVVGVGLASGLILSMYGHEFVKGGSAFWILVATTIPMVATNIFMQFLVAQQRMWEQLGYYVVQAVPLVIGYYLFVADYGALGYAVWTAIIAVLICAIVVMRVRVDHSTGEKTSAHKV